MRQLVDSLLHVFEILIVGVLFLKLIDSALKRIAKIVPSDEAHRNRVSHRTETLRHFVRSVGKTILGVVVLISAAKEYNPQLDLQPFFGTAAIAGLAIGFGAQSLVKDVIAGFFVLLEDQYGVGETIRVGVQEGVVESMTLRVTVLRSADGEVHVIPNGSIQTLTVLSRDWRRAVLDVDVSSKEDIGRVLQVLGRINEELARAMDSRVLRKPEVIGIERITGSAVTFRLAARTTPSESGAVTHEWRRRIKEGFDREKIRLPEGPADWLQGPRSAAGD